MTNVKHRITDVKNNFFFLLNDVTSQSLLHSETQYLCSSWTFYSYEMENKFQFLFTHNILAKPYTASIMIEMQRQLWYQCMESLRNSIKHYN